MQYEEAHSVRTVLGLLLVLKLPAIGLVMAEVDGERMCPVRCPSLSFYLSIHLASTSGFAILGLSTLLVLDPKLLSSQLVVDGWGF